VQVHKKHGSDKHGNNFTQKLRRKVMAFVETARNRFGIVGELLSFFAKNKRWWLLPVVTMVLFMAVLIILGQSSAIAPFIYTLF
jgi:hypothetical protein